MKVNEKAMELACPVCDAKAREKCHPTDGHVMPEPHSARKHLVLGIKPRNRREEINQAAARIVRESTERS